ncbi:MAG TPA: HEAT repeat domain-containing protein, partial [Candidatus Saccharimonadales bacterium]|nr:HEAT repeat domain-containing protein [Candidatus Saccharimonadales bacterium]
MISEKVNRYLRMLGDGDHRLRAIQRLEVLGEEALEALPELWNIVKDQSGEPQVRAAALKAIVTICPTDPQTIEGLLERLAQDPAPEVVLQTAQFLGSFATRVNRELP